MTKKAPAKIRIWLKSVARDVAKRARTKLIMLNQARELSDLRVPPANRLVIPASPPRADAAQKRATRDALSKERNRYLPPRAPYPTGGNLVLLDANEIASETDARSIDVGRREVTRRSGMPPEAPQGRRAGGGDGIRTHDRGIPPITV